MKTHLTLEQRIHNAQLSQESENVKARHSYLHARCDGASEFATLWIRSDETGWAHQFGCMKGFDQSWRGNVANYEKMGISRWMKMVDIYPEISGKDFRPLMEASVHTLTCDVIEVADDGKSVRASYVTPGAISSTLDPDEHKWCHIMWERYGSDFMVDEEDGELKYFNEQVCPDIVSELDFRDWAAEEYERLVNPSAPPMEMPIDMMPALTYPGPWHFPYGILQTPQHDVMWPEPYETLDKEHSYNNPDIPEHQRFKEMQPPVH